MQIINANFTLSIFELTEVQSFLHSDDKHMLVIDEEVHPSGIEPYTRSQMGTTFQ